MVLTAGNALEVEGRQVGAGLPVELGQVVVPLAYGRAVDPVGQLRQARNPRLVEFRRHQFTSQVHFDILIGFEVPSRHRQRRAV